MAKDDERSIGVGREGPPVDEGRREGPVRNDRQRFDRLTVGQEKPLREDPGVEEEQAVRVMAEKIPG